MSDKWNTQGFVANHDVAQHIQSSTSARQAGRAGNTGTGSNRHSVIGIKTTEVENMVGAIDLYIKAIYTEIEKINTESKAQAAKTFQSAEINAALDSYFVSVINYCKNMTSGLDAFSDKLIQVKMAWEQSAAQFANDGIGASKSALDSVGEYTRDFSL